MRAWADAGVVELDLDDSLAPPPFPFPQLRPRHPRQPQLGEPQRKVLPMCCIAQNASAPPRTLLEVELARLLTTRLVSCVRACCLMLAWGASRKQPGVPTPRMACHQKMLVPLPEDMPCCALPGVANCNGPPPGCEGPTVTVVE